MDISALFEWMKAHRETLTWLAGGATTAAGGVWVVVRYFFDRSSRCSKPAASLAPPDKPHREPAASATDGGLAVGRDLLRAGRDIKINRERIPRPAIALAALGLLLLGYALVSRSGDISVQNGSFVGGDVSGSRIEVTGSGTVGGPSR